jgi:hypothetical protein
MGAGLHVAALALEGETHVTDAGIVLSVAIPYAIYALAFYFIYSVVVRTSDPFHLGLMAGTAAVLGLAILLASAGVAVSVCLLVVTLAPAVTVVGYETVGHRHIAEAFERM